MRLLNALFGSQSPETEESPPMQRISDDVVRRESHVWYAREDGSWKCAICGGVSFTPSDNCDCVRYEQLTEEEKRMCLPRDPPPVQPADQRDKTDRRDCRRGRRK